MNFLIFKQETQLLSNNYASVNVFGLNENHSIWQKILSLIGQLALSEYVRRIVQSIY